MFLPLRESDDIEEFLTDVYSEIEMDPQNVEYVEAHGAGEVNSILLSVHTRFRIKYTCY